MCALWKTSFFHISFIISAGWISNQVAMLFIVRFLVDRYWLCRFVCIWFNLWRLYNLYKWPLDELESLEINLTSRNWLKYKYLYQHVLLRHRGSICIFSFSFKASKIVFKIDYPRCRGENNKELKAAGKCTGAHTVSISWRLALCCTLRFPLQCEDSPRPRFISFVFKTL